MLHLILLLLPLLLATLLASFAPLYFTLSQTRIQTISTYATGLLVGAALVIIIPEGVEGVYESKAGKHHEEMGGWIGGALLFGFMLMYIIDTFSPHAHSEAIRPSRTKRASLYRSVSSISELEPLSVSHSLSHQHDSHVREESPTRLSFDWDTEEMSTPTSPALNSAPASASPSSASRRPNTSLSTVIGLLAHSLADGISLGAASISGTTTIGSSGGAGLEMIVFIAIMLHKAPTAFALASLLIADASCTQSFIRKSLIAFSLASPVGAILTYVLLGIVGVGEGSDMGWWTGMALVFSGGTFLFVATHVMVKKDGQHKEESENLATGGVRPMSDTAKVALVIAGMVTPDFSIHWWQSTGPAFTNRFAKEKRILQRTVIIVKSIKVPPWTGKSSMKKQKRLQIKGYLPNVTRCTRERSTLLCGHLMRMTRRVWMVHQTPQALEMTWLSKGVTNVDTILESRDHEGLCTTFGTYRYISNNLISIQYNYLYLFMATRAPPSLVVMVRSGSPLLLGNETPSEPAMLVSTFVSLGFTATTFAYAHSPRKVVHRSGTDSWHSLNKRVDSTSTAYLPNIITLITTACNSTCGALDDGITACVNLNGTDQATAQCVCGSSVLSAIETCAQCIVNDPASTSGSQALLQYNGFAQQCISVNLASSTALATVTGTDTLVTGILSTYATSATSTSGVNSTVNATSSSALATSSSSLSSSSIPSSSSSSDTGVITDYSTTVVYATASPSSAATTSSRAASSAERTALTRGTALLGVAALLIFFA
ncbi:Zip-domain-containing protein [Meredithblackwellia eburnea MCA 4105]